MYQKILIFCCMVLSLGTIAAQEWKLSKSNDQIKVYTRHENDSRFNTIKVVAEFNGSIDKLIRILKDVNNNKNWVYKTNQARVIEIVNPHEFTYYAETSVPWPFSNRDMVIRMQFFHDATNDTLLVKATGLPEGIAQKEGLVRIKKFEGLWQVKQVSENKIAIQYLLKINPGGNIPPGISNLFVSNGPFETFNNLSKLLSR